MHIVWYGQSFVQITAQPCSIAGGKRKCDKVNIIIDPVRARKADVLLITQARLLPKVKEKEAFLIVGPGEYETKGVFFQGVPSGTGERVYYIIEAEEMRLCHLAEMPSKELTDKQLEEIGNVDILMLQTGLLTPKIISQIEPCIVIPMYEKGQLNKFLKTMGQKTIEPQEKLVIKKKDLPQEEMELVVLKF